jgi:hypothetical protein
LINNIIVLINSFYKAFPYVCISFFSRKKNGAKKQGINQMK